MSSGRFKSTQKKEGDIMYSVYIEKADTGKFKKVCSTESRDEFLQFVEDKDDYATCAFVEHTIDSDVLIPQTRVKNAFNLSMGHTTFEPEKIPEDRTYRVYKDSKKGNYKVVLRTTDRDDVIKFIRDAYKCTGFIIDTYEDCLIFVPHRYVENALDTRVDRETIEKIL